MRKLLVICGPTATGKTKLALHLAKKFKGEVVSADSRQVYRGMDIGTGKDLPKNSKLEIRNSKLGGSYKIAGVPVWGYDLVEPTEEFSVGQYITISRSIVKDIWKRGKLPIVEGGTGLYLNGMLKGVDTAKIPKDTKLRKSLEGKPVDELFELLRTQDAVRAANLNQSDKNNSRRLIRAIEISQSKKSFMLIDPDNLDSDILWIGLRAGKDYLKDKINRRVDERLRMGFEKELKKLINNGCDWNMQSMTSLGYVQWKKYLEGGATKDRAILNWKNEELKYTKRQTTWFKRNKIIQWFDIEINDWNKSIENEVKKWYSSN